MIVGILTKLCKLLNDYFRFGGFTPQTLPHIFFPPSCHNLFFLFSSSLPPTSSLPSSFSSSFLHPLSPVVSTACGNINRYYWVDLVRVSICSEFMPVSHASEDNIHPHPTAPTFVLPLLPPCSLGLGIGMVPE